MSRIAKTFLLVVAPVLATLLALLGIKTFPSNPLGWFLLLVGVVYTVGVVIVFIFRKDQFWDSSLEGEPSYEERGDRSLWFISLGMIAVFYLSPVEYIWMPSSLPRTAWMGYSGLGLVTLGAVLFVWARRVLGVYYSGHLSVKTGQALVQSGPYHLIRHPAYKGYLLMALGISLGYSSLAGLVSVLVLLVMLIYRIKLEEKLLTKQFGATYHQYKSQTKRLIPWIW